MDCRYKDSKLKINVCFREKSAKLHYVKMRLQRFSFTALFFPLKLFRLRFFTIGQSSKSFHLCRWTVLQLRVRSAQGGRKWEEWGGRGAKGDLIFGPIVLVLINLLKEFVRFRYMSLYIPLDQEKRHKSIWLITRTTVWIIKSPLIVCVAWECEVLYL